MKERYIITYWHIHGKIADIEAEMFSKKETAEFRFEILSKCPSISHLKMKKVPFTL
jgi:hypothetical protein